MNERLPGAFGASVLSATIRSSPEDFFVEEIAGFEPSGEGEHFLLTIEKRGLTTAAAAKRIAEWAGLPEMAIGYAGIDDLDVSKLRVWLGNPDESVLVAEHGGRAARYLEAAGPRIMKHAALPVRHALPRRAAVGSSIVPGTFAPIPSGHLDVLRRASRRFDRIVIGVASNPGKGPLVTARRRVELILPSLAALPNVIEAKRNTSARR